MENKNGAQWAFGQRDMPALWPADGSGRPEPGALLLAAQSELGSAADVTIALLESAGIPALKAGSQGKVILGFAGLGVDIYVPQSRLEEAQALLNAPAEGDDAPEGADE